MDKYLRILACIFFILGLVFKSTIPIIMAILLVLYDFIKYEDILDKIK